MELIDIYKRIFCQKEEINQQNISDVQIWNIKDISEWYLKNHNILEESIGYYMDLYKPVHKFLNVYEILNQYVQDPSLTPVPKQLLDKIIENIKITEQNIYDISYKDIYLLLNKYDYQYVDEFKQNLLNYTMFNGRLYIAFLQLDQSLDYFNNKTLNKLSDKFNDFEKALDIMNELIIHKDTTALTIKQEILKNSTFIFLNKNKTKSYISDTIQHQLTHFVQRIVGLDKSLTSFITTNNFYNKKAIDFNKKLFKYLHTLISNNQKDKQKINDLYKFCYYFLSLREIHQSQKRILSGFQRAYQKDIKYFVRDNINRRQIWLNKFLKNINGNKIDLDFKLNAITFKERLPIIIFMYKVIKEIFPNEQLDKKLQQHFKKFQFRG